MSKSSTFRAEMGLGKSKPASVQRLSDAISAFPRQKNNQPNFSYDPSTDSLYVEIREGKTIHTIAHDDRNFYVDIGEDGEPVGYDIQHATEHPDVIVEALGCIRRLIKE